MKWIRKITISRDKYGYTSIPRVVLQSWVARGVTHVNIKFDEGENVLIISPMQNEVL